MFTHILTRTVFVKTVFKSLPQQFRQMSTLTPEKLNIWSHEIQSDPTLSLAATLAANSDVQESLIKRNRKISFEKAVFNHVVDPLGSPVTNQQNSGRCWLFAATNMLRLNVMREYKLDNFRLSPSHLFFYDKLEKANFFLNQIVDTASESVDSRLVQHLLTDPISDGGQFGMFVNIIKKYGIVPYDEYPDSYNALKSRQLNQMVTTLLRQYAQELREAVAAGKETGSMIDERMKHIHQLLVIFLGNPLGPNDKFTWEYVDKDKKYNKVETTPLDFVRKLNFDFSKTVSLLNDPRNNYRCMVHIERLGNVIGSEEVTYLNVDIDTLAQKAIDRIKANKAVFFGTHTPIYHHNNTGIIDIGLWDYQKLGFHPQQSKADRLRYHQSLMTHAMLFVGVQLDAEGKPVRWKVENSWGEDRGQKGYYCMSHDFFKEYVYQVVVDESDIPEFRDVLDTKPINLPPWDPCGSLATN